MVFLKDPCGIVCIFVTYAAIFYADYAVIRWIVYQTMANSLWGAFNVITFNTVILLLAMSHFKAVFSDPGVIPLPQHRIDFSDMLDGAPIDFVEQVEWTVCTRCETYRPPRAHHCRICQRCVKRMDHHCPWINNCVGERNQKYFLQFLVYVGILAVYAIALVAVSWLTECPECTNDVPIKQRRIMHSVILFGESVLFGLFVLAILIDQLQAILNDETSVERVQKQGSYRAHKPKLALLGDVCGRQHPVLWLLPCYPAPRKFDPLMNYDV